MVKVLVIDDDSHFRGIIERIILRSYTYSVKSVASEEEAWEYLSKNSYDLVILDLYIDGKKSWDTLKRIKALPSSPVVIMISCEDLAENAEYAKALGAADFVPKPIDFGRLKTTVDAATGWGGHLRSVGPVGDEGKTTGGVEQMRVLVVAGEMSDLEVVRHPLEQAGFRTIVAETLQDAREMVPKEPVDALLVCPGGDRERVAETYRSIREEAAGYPLIPIIALSDASSETILALLKAGADDYVTPPFDPRILAAKVEAHIRLRREYDLRLEEVVSRCVKDALTGSYNHSYFKARLHEEFHRSRRYQRNLVLAILRLGNLEKVKADFGSPAGDRILTETSRFLRAAFRRSDVLARSGEAEFALILPEATSERILPKADKVRSGVQEKVSLVDDRRTGITCNMGLASIKVPPDGGVGPDPVQSPEDLWGMANMALTRARGAGNGGVEVFGR